MVQRVKYLDAQAGLSADGVYRYWLKRRLSMSERIVAFCGLNPSTAAADTDDSTVRKEVAFARQWGFDWYFKGNLYAFRSTDPKALYRESTTDPIGPENQAALAWLVLHADLIVAAWGQNKLTAGAKTLADRILSHPKTRCLGVNQDGSPKHPLYLPYTSTLIEVPSQP